jgi:DNA-binding transcriptional regulator YhcF (GntR family)
VSEPIYRRIAASIAADIAAGVLEPGSRVPSTRQIIATHGVAMATASKVLATLQADGLVETRPGIGTVVRGSPRARPGRDRVLRTAVTIADAEGLAGLSMRRLAGALGVPTMFLYRHVADKEELVLLMMDEVMGANPPPATVSPALDGWRPCLEALARLQWQMYRRHPWLAQAVSFTRPLLAPRAMAHTEWAMRALDSHGLPPDLVFRAAVTVANYVRGTAVGLAEEAEAEQETAMTDKQWLDSQQGRLAAVLATGMLPMIARFLAQDTPFDLDILLEFGLQRLLDGLAALLDPPQSSRRR